MVVVYVRETCAVRRTLVDRRCCCYSYCRRVPVCLTAMSAVVSAADQRSDVKSSPQHSPAVRIQVDLFEPTDSRYPVFNYQKLLADEVSAPVECTSDDCVSMTIVICAVRDRGVRACTAMVWRESRCSVSSARKSIAETLGEASLTVFLLRHVMSYSISLRSRRRRVFPPCRTPLSSRMLSVFYSVLTHVLRDIVDD